MANLRSVASWDDFLPSAEACVEAWELLLATPALKEWHEKPETLKLTRVVYQTMNGTTPEGWSICRHWREASLTLETQLAHRLLPLMDLAKKTTIYTIDEPPIEHVYPNPEPSTSGPRSTQNTWPVSMEALATGRAGVLAKARQAHLNLRFASPSGRRHRS